MARKGRREEETTSSYCADDSPPALVYRGARIFVRKAKAKPAKKVPRVR